MNDLEATMASKIPRIGLGTKHEGFYLRPDTTIVVLFSEEDPARRFADTVGGDWQPFTYPDDASLRNHLEVWHDAGYVVEIDADGPSTSGTVTVTAKMILEALQADQDSLRLPETED
jgi:hypothetical protein